MAQPVSFGYTSAEEHTLYTPVQGKASASTGYRTRRRLLHTMVYLFAIAVAITAFYPFFVMLIGSTHDSYNIVTRLNLLPGSYFVRNYQRLTKTYDIWRGFANSVFLSVVRTAVSLYLSALAAYAFAKFRFKGQAILYGMVLATMMLPGQIGVIGYYKLIDGLYLMDTYTALVLEGAVNCFAIFLFRQYLDGCLPNDLIEASLADGCGEAHIFHRLALPLMKPILVAQGILTFIGSWNSYMMPLVLLYSQNKMTLPLMIAGVRDALTTDYGAQFVGMLISVVPLVVVFCLGSKAIMEEISVGAAIKG